MTFATPDWSAALDRLTASARRFGADHILRRGVNDLLGTPFHFAHLDLFAQRRGFGYWIWKPHVILDALQRVNDGDVVVYSDAGVEWTAPMTPLVELARERTPIVAFGLRGHTNRMWTKRDAFVALGCDAPRFWDAEACAASIVVLRKCADSVALVEEWRRWCTTGRLVTDDPNAMGKPNLPGFREHRHDQALLSLLCERLGLERFRDPTEWGAHDARVNSPYGTLANHHRARGPAPGAP